MDAGCHKSWKIGKLFCMKPLYDDGHDVLKPISNFPPAHYWFKIESFSLLVDSKFERHESGVFEAGGYKWMLSLYPRGKVKGEKEYISLYLVLAETARLPLGFEIDVSFNFFMYDQIRDKFCTVLDGGVNPFHKMKTERGSDQLISSCTFNDPATGYLSDDSCVFGVEVTVFENGCKSEFASKQCGNSEFASKHGGKSECLSLINLIKNRDTRSFVWKIEKFSAITEDFLYSQKFLIGTHKWRLLVYPKGTSNAKGIGLSLFLVLSDYATLGKVYAKYKLRVRGQASCKAREIEDEHQFSKTGLSAGCKEMLSLGDLKDAWKGFKVDDCIIVEVKFMVVSVFKDF